ncbi:phage integrase family protein [Luminiphilus syltensis NOR5-1B]|uniref:Phage integrase family protein n=1 Tax=Luminiphilus syltensis NOR5-1B TaxID=565045 RepID=B8KSH6_9GAMM|nr:tyrosine-type recombinase/integrase [Luminiphilus syltensis]EED36241.1 phage integrase family protein [Luminiphilus syltensis NOR5-1B]
MFYLVDDTAPHPPWNKGKLIGQKKPLKLKEIWTIRVRLQMASDVRGLALFNLAIDSKLRACDLVKLRVTDVTHGNKVMRRATVMQQKTHQRVQFEITEDTREAVSSWIDKARLQATDYLFASRVRGSSHISTRQYARIVHHWIDLVGLDGSDYGTHSLRRTKASLIYQRTKNLRAVQLLLGHTKLESTVRYLGVEVDDALELAEQTEV